MFKYDTVHGRFKGTVTHDAENVIVNGKPIRVFNAMNVREGAGGRARQLAGQLPTLRPQLGRLWMC